MAGVITLTASVAVDGPQGREGPWSVLYQTQVTLWSGRQSIQIPATATQVNLVTGLTTVMALMLLSDQALTVYLGGSSAPALPLPAFAPLVMAGVATALVGGGYLGGQGSATSGVYLKNNSGTVANVTYAVGGN